MDQTELQSLFRIFAQPLASYAAFSAEREQLAEMLSRNLWTALIAGPQAEELMWIVLTTEGNLKTDQLELIQTCYYEQMKPSVSQGDLIVLRAKYEVRHEQAGWPVKSSEHASL